MNARRASVLLLAALCVSAISALAEGWDLTGARPTIRGAGLWASDRPIYLTGVWVGGTVTTCPSLYKPDIDGENIAYSKVLSAETAPLLGINSAHPPMSPLRVMRSTGWFTEDRHTQPRWDEFQAFVRGCGQLPLTVDCAGIAAFRSETVPAELKQVGAGWHGFVPLCPEHPDAWKLYESYWQDCARQIVEAGANAIIYEMFNEPAYNCRCAYNKREFATRMATKYESIEAADRVWRTSFASFDDVAGMEAPDETPGLWCDWIKFIGDRYVEILATGKAAIKSVDGREPMYFLDQASIGHTYLRCNGIDPTKVNALMDIAGVEGGVSFGTTQWREAEDPMAQVLEIKGIFSHQLYLDMARAFGKPVINTETYCGRFYQNVRFPSHREDILTELWEEMIHGACGSYFYNWGRRWWEWQDLAGAKRAAREIHYKAFSMLNPYAYPPDSLNGFKDFLRDMEIVGDELLGGPRIEGQVALLISQPTMRQVFRKLSYTEKGPYEDTIREWYAALIREQIPVDVVWEEQLATTDLSRYRAILAPGAEYAYRQTQAPLKRFTDGGGLLIATSGAFGRDEYGEPWIRGDDEEPLAMPVGAQFVDEGLRGRELQSELRGLLFSNGDFRGFRVVPADDERRTLVCEAYEVRRATGDYYYIVNWEIRSRLARLRVANSEGREVVASLDGARYAEGDVAGQGVLVHLPSQTRTLVLVAKPGANIPRPEERWTEADVRERYVQALGREKAELEAVAGELAADRAVADARRVSFGGPTNEAGEYLPDEHTVVLLHLNGGFDQEPARTAGAISFIEGKFGTQAAHFGPDAATHFALPDGFDKDTGAIECWARPDWPTADGKRHTLVELKGPGAWNQNRLMIYKNLDYEIAFAVYDRNKTALAIRVPINIFRQHQWTHVCGTWDVSQGLRFYVNGKLRGTKTGAFEIERFDALEIGADHAFSRPWEGALDELRLSRGERNPEG